MLSRPFHSTFPLFCDKLQTMRKIIQYYFCGLAIGAADVVPGISGGTIAFLLGLYHKLLAGIQSFDLEFVRLLMAGRCREAGRRIPWSFLVPLGLGIATSIFSLARVIILLLAAYPTAIWSFFFGLILSSLVMVARTIPFKGLANILPFLAGFVFAWGLTGLSTISAEPTWPIYFGSAFVAVCALLLPGISGATVLVLLGQYHHIVQAVAARDWPVLVVFAAGCVCGLLTFARVVSAFLRRFPVGGSPLMIGLMLGSLRTVWPWQAEGYPAWPTPETAIVPALLCGLLGMALPLILNALSKRFNSPGSGNSASA
jgi:putative membrane protein